MGVSGLPRATENKYRALPQFGSLPPLPDNVPSRQTDHNSGRISGGTVRLGAGAAEWDVSQPSRGLGDVVAKITHATGIDKLVKAVTGKKGCGCKKRAAKLNEKFPFQNKDKPS
jgi:hypothetical protein